MLYIYMYTIYIYAYYIYIYILAKTQTRILHVLLYFYLFAIIFPGMIADFIHFIDSLPLLKLSTSGTPYSYGIPLSALNTAPEVLHTGLGENDLLGSMIAKHLGATASQTHSDGFVLHASINIMKKNNTMSHA